MKKVHISNNIVFLRNYKNISQRKMAQDLGIGRSSLRKWETGDSIPDIFDIARLLEYFDVETDDLIYKDIEEMYNDEEQIKQLSILLKDSNISDENDNMSKEHFYKFINFINSSYKLFCNK